MKYHVDLAILKDYGSKRKLTLCRSVLKAGYELEVFKRDRGTANEEKLDNNISRSRSTIFELASCNPWTHFMTLTIDQTKYDRHDLKTYQKDLAHWLRNYNYKHQIKIDYVMIPEMHKDGSWHLHGLLMGLPEDHLKTNEHGYLDWFPYRNKFGYCSIDRIKSHEAVSKYITKYITKDLADCVKELNANMYYCTQGLKRAQEIKRGTLAATNVPWDYGNEYVKCCWFDSQADELLGLIQG